MSLDILHTSVGDLSIRLTDPDLVDLVDLVVSEGGTGDNFTDTVFDDSAATSIVGASAPFTGTFRPEELFAELFPGAINGQWALMIQNGEGGELLGASITITYNAPPQAVAIQRSPRMDR